MIQYKQEYKLFESQTKKDFTLRYILAKPADLREGEKLPLIVSLHGAGERGSDLEILRVMGIPKYLNEGLPIRGVILAPQLESKDVIWNTVIHELMELVCLIRDHEEGVDSSYVAVTGMSMGGYATWEIAMSYTGAFQAIAPICGGGTYWRAWRLADLPIRAYHGDADDTVYVNATLEMVDAVKAAGGNPECVILHGVGHDCWHWAYEHTDLLQWLVSHKKQPEA